MEEAGGEALRQEIIAYKEKSRGVVLTDQEIIELVYSDPIDLEHLIKWYNAGSEISVSQRPVERFADIVRDNFDALTKEEKEKLLKGATQLIFGEPKAIVIIKRERRPHWFLKDKDYVAIESEPLMGSTRLKEANGKNVGELLVKALEFSEGDIQLARRLVSQHGSKSKNTTKSSAKAILFSLAFNTEEGISPVEEYKSRNPKISQLAFWVSADLNMLNPMNSTFDQLLLDFFPKADSNLKTEIMIFVKEQLSTRKVPYKKYAYIKQFLVSNQQLFNGLKTSHPDLPFVEAFESIGKVLAFDELLMRVKGGRISPEDLTNLLNNNPQLISYVTEDELERARDVTKDHYLAFRLEEILRNKRESFTT